MSLLGKPPRLPVGVFRAHGLTPFRKLLPPEVFSTLWPRDPSPRAVLVPEVIFWLMASVVLNDGAMGAAVIHFWSALRVSMPWIPAEPLTEEAFCIARRNLPVRFFRRLFHSVVARYDVAYGDRYRWRGFRLLGIDGTDVTLPRSKAMSQAFSTPSNQNGAAPHPQGLLVGLVGLWSGVCHHFRWVPLRRGEQECARVLAHGLRPGDLLLGDRNFVSYRLFHAVLCRGAHFLMRLADDRYRSLPRRKTSSGRPDEEYVDVPVPPALHREYPSLPATLTLRILHYQIPGFRPSRLITSLLDTPLYPYEELIALYHERWRQETAHAEWKHSLQISNLRSLSPDGILKEILVQLTLNNLTRWVMTEAVGAAGRPVDLQFRDCKRLLTQAVFVMQTAAPENLLEIYRRLLAAMRAQRIRVRPGRSYPRKNDARPRDKGSGATARPARLLPEKGLCNVPV